VLHEGRVHQDGGRAKVSGGRDATNTVANLLLDVGCVGHAGLRTEHVTKALLPVDAVGARRDHDDRPGGTNEDDRFSDLRHGAPERGRCVGRRRGARDRWRPPALGRGRRRRPTSVGGRPWSGLNDVDILRANPLLSGFVGFKYPLEYPTLGSVVKTRR